MWRITLTAISLMGVASAQSHLLIKHDLTPVMYDSATACPSIWTARGLLGIVFHPGTTDGPLLTVLQRNALLDYNPFSFPGGRYYNFAGIAERPDGGVEIAGTAGGEDGKPIHFIAHITANGAITTVTITTPYQPFAMTVAPGGIIWTIGFLPAPDPRNARDNVLRRFSPTGVLISSTPVNVNSYRYRTGDSILRASADRVAWLTNTNEYLEFSLDGREITHIKGPSPDSRYSHHLDFAMSPANEVVISAPDSRNGETTLWTLVRHPKLAWTEVATEENFSPQDRLFGFDAGYLVASGTVELPGQAPRQALIHYKLATEEP